MLLQVDRPFAEGQTHWSEIIGNIVSSRPYSSAGARADVTVVPDLDVSGVGMDGAPPSWPGFFTQFQDGRSEPTHWTLRNKLARHCEVMSGGGSRRR
jgi:hypothetical protein